MQKQAPTFGRLAVMVGFALSCFGLLLFLWLAFGGPVPLQPKGYRLHTSFGEATQLSKEADVRISGVSVGKVKDIVTDAESGRSDATIELESRYAPLPRDTRATLRQKTLLGETYVELTPGSRKAGFVAEDGTLPAANVSPTVELDEIFRAFDPKTRREFQSWMQELAVASKGRGRDLNDTLGNLSPFAQDTNALLKILNAQKGAVRALSANTGEVFEALSENRGRLASLITNSNRVFEVTARRNEELQETFRALPTFEREATQTVNRLTAFSGNANPLITQLRPAARQLSPTLTDLSALSPDLKALFRDLGPLITASKAGLPATQRFLDELRPFLGATDPALAQLNPILTFVGQYKDELNSFFANTVATTQATTEEATGPNLHYLRTTNPLNLESLALYKERLGSNRANPYQLPRAYQDLKDGLPVFDARTCGRGNVPNVIPRDTVTALLGADASRIIGDLVSRVGGPATQTAAPPCRQQGKFDFGGELTQYPHVNPARNGSSPSGSGR
ncbi:MAG: hypothetical protein JWO90_3194 [Solirubrobacterales bacterium]|nr:hypothetical protein [Solirubrobacterales bacterium]